jgi:hypothetical protein
MADIVLAHSSGQTWLVSGEKYIDDLLAGTLPADVTVEFVACETYADIDRLWSQGGDAIAGFEAPWLINPAIVARIRGTAEHSVVFTQWSAHLNENARAVIARFAASATEIASAEVLIVSYAMPDSLALQTDLANLRSAVIEAELIALGVGPRQIVRASRTIADGSTNAGETERIDILLNRQ